MNPRPPRPSQGMTFIQPVTYRGQTVAACTAQRFFLADELASRPLGDPELTFVVFMCAYAVDVAAGVIPGAYNERDARRYARACLIPDELLERPDLSLERAARALRVPAAELRDAQADWRAANARP